MFEIEVVTTKKKLTKSILDQLPRCSFKELVIYLHYNGGIEAETHWVKLHNRPVYYLIKIYDTWKVFEDLGWEPAGLTLRCNYPFKSVVCESYSEVYIYNHVYLSFKDKHINNQIII